VHLKVLVGYCRFNLEKQNAEKIFFKVIVAFREQGFFLPLLPKSQTRVQGWQSLLGYGAKPHGFNSKNRLLYDATYLLLIRFNIFAVFTDYLIGRLYCLFLLVVPMIFICHFDFNVSLFPDIS
jgi:hypothetical protein